MAHSLPDGVTVRSLVGGDDEPLRAVDEVDGAAASALDAPRRLRRHASRRPPGGMRLPSTLAPFFSTFSGFRHAGDPGAM